MKQVIHPKTKALGKKGKNLLSVKLPSYSKNSQSLAQSPLCGLWIKAIKQHPAPVPEEEGKLAGSEEATKAGKITECGG